MAWKRVGRGIRKRTDAEGNVTYYVDVTRNKRRIVKAVGPNLDMARQVRGRMLAEAVERERFPERFRTEQVALQELIERYITDHMKAHSPRTWRKRSSQVRKLGGTIGSERIVSGITTADCQRVLSALRSGGASPGYCNRNRDLLKSLFSRAKAWGYIVENPVDNIPRQHEEGLGDRFLLDHEYRALVATIAPDVRPLVVLACHTGCRAGEFLNLRWSDVDLETDYLTVRAEIAKSGRERRVPLNRDALGALAEHGPPHEGYVLPYRTFPWRKWYRVIRALGWMKTEIPRLRGWRFHDCRHNADLLIMPRPFIIDQDPRDSASESHLVESA